MKKILQFLFPRIIEELQYDALHESWEKENAQSIHYAKQGIPFYVYEKGGQEGLQHLYKYTPTDLGIVSVVMKRPRALSGDNAFMKQEKSE